MKNTRSGKNQNVLEMTCENCLDYHYGFEYKNPITVECSMSLLEKLLRMMKMDLSREFSNMVVGKTKQ